MHRRKLLGVYGIHAVLIHRREIVPHHRPVPWMMKRCASIRSWGVAEALPDDFTNNVSLGVFTAKGEMLAEILPETREYGRYRGHILMQQLAEATLREHLANYPRAMTRLTRRSWPSTRTDSAIRGR